MSGQIIHSCTFGGIYIMSLLKRWPLPVLGLTAAASLLLACTTFISSTTTLAQTPAVAPTTAPASQPASPLDGYPKVVLGDKDFQVEVATPDVDGAYYQGQRFDHTGMIQRVTYKGHVYFDRYQPIPHNPKLHDDIGGLAEEFGIQNPPGYAEANPGDPFLKIGVGLLKKPGNDIYMFWTPYEVLSPASSRLLSHPEDHLRTPPGNRPNSQPQMKFDLMFTQMLGRDKAWSYIYNKGITVDASQGKIIITRNLSNLGKKPIKVEHYSHNFMFFDDKEIDSSYKLEMPQPIIVENKDFLASATVDGNVIRPSKHLDGMAGTLFTLADPKAPFTFKVSNDNGASVTITQSIAPPKFQLWMTTRAFCPEPFTLIDLAPGKSIEWSTTYQFGQ